MNFVKNFELESEYQERKVWEFNLFDFLNFFNFLGNYCIADSWFNTQINCSKNCRFENCAGMIKDTWVLEHEYYFNYFRNHSFGKHNHLQLSENTQMNFSSGSFHLCGYFSLYS